MARGRRSSLEAEPVGYVPRRKKSPEYDPYSADANVFRLKIYNEADARDLSQKSKGRDKKLMKDICQRLNRVEFDGVKTSRDVRCKTGFRRRIYNPSLVPLEKATRHKRRKDELKFPWDNTVTDNVFRGVKQDRSKLISSDRKKRESLRDFRPKPLIKTGEYSELAADLPQSDPLGVYRPRPKVERKNYYEYLHPTNKYDHMTLYEIVARVRAKTEAMPKQRSRMKEVDDLLSDLNRPLPKNKDEGNWIVSTVDSYPEMDAADVTRDGLDERLQKKMAASRNDLADFERMLEARFGKERARVVPTRTTEVRRYAAKNEHKMAVESEEEEGAEREVGLEPTFDEPVVIQRSAHVTRAPARSAVGVGSVHVRPRHVAAVHTGRSGGHVRSSSVPASARQPVRRSRLADLESSFGDDIDPDWSFAPVRPYCAAPISHTTSVRARSASMERRKPPTGRDVIVVRSTAARMPELDRYRSPTLTSATATKPPVAPYKAVSRPRSNSESVGPQLRGNFRPQVSETRRRLREVICSTRKDPRYFD